MSSVVVDVAETQLDAQALGAAHNSLNGFQFLQKIGDFSDVGWSRRLLPLPA